MPMENIRASLLLSVQGGLLGAVPHNLRAVTCEWENTHIRLRFVFHGEISEDDREDAQIVGTEVIAGFPEHWTIEEEIIRSDHPADVRLQGLAHWAYLRRET